MKYFYIICLALSSFFTYKHLSATEQLRQYAFFMPNNAFLRNTDGTDVTINAVRQRVQKDEETMKIPERQIVRPFVHKKVQRMQPDDEIIYEKPKMEELDTIHTSQQKIDDNESFGNILSDEDKARLEKYSLSDELEEDLNHNEDAKKDEKPVKKLSLLEEYSQLSISEMFAKIPFPDDRLPKYKQRYSTYNMDLRVLHRNGELPYNRELEEALAKANTIQRFTVE